MPMLGCRMEWRPSSIVPSVWIGPFLEKEADHVTVTPFSRDLERSYLVATLDVDVCSVRNQGLRQVLPVIIDSMVEGRLPGLVASLHVRVPFQQGFHNFLAVCPV